MTLELSPVGQCVELLAEIVDLPNAGLCYETSGGDFCHYCNGHWASNGRWDHEPTCPITRARKLLNIKES